MGLGSSTKEIAAKVLEKALEMQKEYITMSTKFEHMEGAFKDLIEQNSRFVDKLESDNRKLWTKIGEIDSIINATFKQTLHSALMQAIKDAEDGSVKEPEVIALLSSRIGPDGTGSDKEMDKD